MAVWALAQLLPATAFNSMKLRRLASEGDIQVRNEWLADSGADTPPQA